MGQEILYCFKCQKRILGGEFAKGQAYQVGHNVCCSACAAELIRTLDPQEREELLTKMFKATQDRQHSSAALPAATPPSGTPARPVSSSSTRMKSAGEGQSKADRRKTTAHIPILRARKIFSSGPSSTVVAVAIVAVLVIPAILLISLSGGSRPAPVPEKFDRSEPPQPPPPPDRSDESRRLESAKAALRKARDFEKDHPRDLQAQIALWEQAQWAADKTPLFDDAKRELARVVEARRDAVSKELGRLEEQAAPRLKAEEYKAAADLFQAARPQYDTTDWTYAIDKRGREIYDTAAKIFPSLLEKAVAARKQGKGAEVDALRARVLRWNFPELTSDLDAALAAATPEPPPPPVKPRSKEADAYLGRWDAALARAASRDYAAALEEIRRASEGLAEAECRAEAAADLDALRAASAVPAEAFDALLKFPKGQKASMAFFNEAGRPERVEGAVVMADATHVVLKQDEGAASVEFGEITPASLAEIFRARPQKKASGDERAATLFCLFEGDADAARAILGKDAGALAQKYWKAAAEIAAARRSGDAAEKEAAARKLYYAAEEGLVDYSKTTQSLASYKALLADHAGTAFVGRNRATLAKRLAIGRDYVYFPDQMKAAGTFKIGKSGKIDPCWTSDHDTDPSKLTENYVELSYSALPDAEYRCWIYAGACCLETFQTSVQATGLKAPSPKNPKETAAAEPGGAASLPLKPTFYLKKTHAMHGGPKTPARWEWMSIPLPKESGAGVKTVRVLTDQQGFSVAYAVISAQRTAPPVESEFKDLERLRTKPAAAAPRDVDLIGYWKLDEGEGAFTADASGNGLGGTLRNSPAWTAGRTGRALSFNGINQYVELGDAPKLYAKGPFTACLWVNPASVGGQPRYLFADYIQKGDQSTFALRLEASGQAGFFWEHPSGVEPKAFSKTKLAPGAWAHLAGVWDGSTRKVYVNGVLEGTDSTAQPRPPGVSMVSIGRPGAYHGFYASGLIDDVRLYSRALGDLEIAALAKGPKEKERPPAPPPSPEVRTGKVVYSENFAQGRGRFSGGEVVDVAPGGAKALALGPKQTSTGGFSVVAKPSTTVRFRIKPLVDLETIECMSWVQAKNGNAWYHVGGLKKGEWKEVEFKAGEMQFGYSTGPTLMGETFDNISFYYDNRPADARVLLADFEVRD